MQEEKATTIGESIFVTGNLSGDEDLTVLGRVEGTISLSQTLYVAESGIVKANVAVDDAVISGVVVGNVTATNSVQITETGRLLGDLRAPRVIIVAGARVRGQVDMSGQAKKPAAYEREAQAAAEARASRSAQGRFERLSLPARRPMHQAPTVARGGQAQHSQAHAQAESRHGPQSAADKAAAHRSAAPRPSHTPVARSRSEQEALRDDHGHDKAESVTASAPRRQVASHNKKRAQARRRD